ncbi:hypothetical protein N0V83_004048 [Neocucurbitaria cava]|uniref:Uncharacterized protein n=1 Tax=Neocucurbitaria cava TaxID=798079 RepID=A0A9W8YB44_9PLEO|nr:hypothetical protein N0V83_004048 [Neocucurbitaria cava]
MLTTIINMTFETFQELAEAAEGYLEYDHGTDAFPKLANAGMGCMSHEAFICETELNIEFRKLARAATAYLEIGRPFVPMDCSRHRVWPQALQKVYQHMGLPPIDYTEFMLLAAAAEGHMAYEVPPYFPGFLQLPPELRGEIMHQYFLAESEASRLSQHRHRDGWGNPCCMWEYPDSLVACDNQDPNTFPDPKTARCPEGWLPDLAFTSKQMLGEVVVEMLRNTKRVELKYIYDHPDFKIATWFRKFLLAIPDGDGVCAVKHLNFPHMHWFNHQNIAPTLSNPSVELMVACSNLRKVDMTFHYSKVSTWDINSGLQVPCTPGQILDHFQLRPILECQSLRQVYLDGIYAKPSRGGEPSDLDALVDLGKWIVKGFLVEQQRKIEVELHRRWGAWDGRLPGVLVLLSVEEEEEAKKHGTLQNGRS